MVERSSATLEISICPDSSDLPLALPGKTVTLDSCNVLIRAAQSGHVVWVEEWVDAWSSLGILVRAGGSKN